MKLKDYWDLIVEIFDQWSDDKAPKLGAALSYYTVFSLAPLLLISIAVAGFMFGRDAARGTIVRELETLIGREGAILIQNAIRNSSNTDTGIIAAVVSMVTLFIGATAAFIELQDSLNIIWKVKSKPGQAIKEFMRTRMISFALVVAIGFLLLVSLLISAAITALNQFMGDFFSIPFWALDIFNLVLSLAVIFVLFSMIFKVLPDVVLSWKDVRMGALVTTILFVVGKYLIGLYLGSSSIASTYGAAGSLAIILVWVYYSAQILFLGAEFTYVYSRRFGSGIHPSRHAVRIEIQKTEAPDKSPSE
ncbi:MAG: YihY/virulence factor BrkB family protein [Bacteroidota bacterium]